MTSVVRVIVSPTIISFYLAFSRWAFLSMSRSESRYASQRTGMVLDYFFGSPTAGLIPETITQLTNLTKISLGHIQNTGKTISDIAQFPFADIFLAYYVSGFPSSEYMVKWQFYYDLVIYLS